MAIEPRFKAGVVVVAGLNFQKALPEVDELHYLQRVTIPVLMWNQERRGWWCMRRVIRFRRPRERGRPWNGWTAIWARSSKLDFTLSYPLQGQNTDSLKADDLGPQKLVARKLPRQKKSGHIRRR